jgi:CRISPR/Cas system-associated protein endoribonuclease Cas2
MNNISKKIDRKNVMIKNEFIDLGFEIWMRLLKNEEQSYDHQNENIERRKDP